MKLARVALSGSGFLAMIHAGAVCALRDAGYTVIEMAGTSGGSIVACAVACGLNNSDLHRLAVMEDMSSLYNESKVKFLLKRYFDDGKNIEAWLEKQFSGKKFSDLTMPLTVMATDFQYSQSFEFSQKMTPDVKLSFASRCSSSVPILYDKMRYQDKILTDGGMQNNLPVDKLTVDDTSERFGIDVVDATYPLPADGLLDFGKSSLSVLLSANENILSHLGASTGATIIPVSAEGADFMDNRKPLAAKQKLYEMGYLAVAKTLASKQRVQK